METNQPTDVRTQDGCEDVQSVLAMPHEHDRYLEENKPPWRVYLCCQNTFNCTRAEIGLVGDSWITISAWVRRKPAFAIPAI